MTIHIPRYQDLLLINTADPTRTLTIRNRFVSDFNGRFQRLMADIREAIIDLDVFGLSQSSNISIPRAMVNAADLNPGAFAFDLDSDKVAEFGFWLQDKMNEHLYGVRGLSATGTLPQAGGRLWEARDAIDGDFRDVWMNTYIDSGYQQGIRRGRQELRKAGISVDEGQLGGGPIGVAFNSPVHADRVGLIYSRSYGSLKGITTSIESDVTNVLAMGLAEGRNPRQLAQLLNKTITGKGEDIGLTIRDRLNRTRHIPGKVRAQVLARTEVIRAHHSANMGEYRAAGLLGIKIQAEHLTAGDARVCPICAPLNGKVYSLIEAEYMIPVHPQCRCVAIPYLPDQEETPQEATGDVLTWKNKNTVSEIEQGLLALANIEKVFGNQQAVNINYGNKAGEYLTEMINKRPSIQGYFKRATPAALEVIEARQVAPGVNGQYFPDTRKISVGGRRTKKGVLSTSISQQRGSPWVVDNGAAGTLRHEYGHYFHMSVMQSENVKDVNHLWSKYVGKSVNKKAVEGVLSEYGSTNHREFFAEIFSAWTHPDYTKGMLPNDIESFMEFILP